MRIRSMMLGVAALAGVASATDVYTSSQIIASMAVPATNTYTLIAVPFKDVNGSAETVKVKDLVKTAGLKAGSKLYYYTGGEYYVWNLYSDDGNWVGVNTAKKVDGKDITVKTPDTDLAVARGATIWLERASESSDSVVLYGEDGDSLTTTITAKSVQLISNPKASDKTITSDVVGTTGDRIMIPQGDGTQTTYEYNGSAWGLRKSSTITIGGKSFPTTEIDTTQSPVIPGGRGAWYVSNGDTVPTINW